MKVLQVKRFNLWILQPSVAECITINSKCYYSSGTVMCHLPILSVHYYLTPKWRISYFFSSPSPFYQMKSEVANRSVQCNKFCAQSYKLWYKCHILTSYLSLIIMIDILPVNIAHTGRSDTSKIWQWRNVWNASPQEKGGWRVKKKFWSQCTQVIILSYKSYRIP